MKKLFTLLLALSLLLTLAACGEEEKEEGSIWDSAKYTEDTTLGQGAKTVKVTVKAEGRSVVLTINTDKDILGEALQDLGLIDGDEGEFGLYIKSVNGMVADYDIDQSYWGFYQKGEYMMSGVDTTKITGGESYELVREK